MDFLWILHDFNATLNIQDRSNRSYPLHHTRAFKALIDSIGVIDLPLYDRNYTWSNGRELSSFVRLDRFLISTTWSTTFPNCVQTIAANTFSDHCPIICECESKFPKPNYFQFENFWLQVDGYNELVETT
jgi:endonuclease/exonuclease/phosphatase family metal-dependent hydrolase